MQNIEKKITKIMEGNYKPSLADNIRIYKEYEINKRELASILSEIYSWLAQNPICVDYKHGKLYMRCEMLNASELFFVHYLYVNKEENITLENYFSQGDDCIIESSIKELVSFVKKMVSDEIDCMQNGS